MQIHEEDDQNRERERREAEELESFSRRAEWMREHYGVSTEEADERVRRAAEEAARMPDADEPDELDTDGE